MAQGLALSLIRFKTLTVWEIMIPVIFILNYVKLKESREIFYSKPDVLPRKWRWMRPWI